MSPISKAVSQRAQLNSTSSSSPGFPRLPGDVAAEDAQIGSRSAHFKSPAQQGTNDGHSVLSLPTGSRHFRLSMLHDYNDSQHRFTTGRTLTLPAGSHKTHVLPKHTSLQLRFAFVPKQKKTEPVCEIFLPTRRPKSTHETHLRERTWGNETLPWVYDNS
ncbi:hypothetical protein TgHK011_008153 [Trichoderma gracile]|nr:hypothetical protein TgHK011_008153 [Trichoderma gracile]